MNSIFWMDSKQVGDVKITLWHYGDYKYQIEFRLARTGEVLKSATMNLDCPYEAAKAEFLNQISRLTNL